jgi:hypothetical protein
MKYGRAPIKVIQFDDLSILKGTGFLKQDLNSTIFRYPNSENKLPIQLTWRMRLYRDGIHIFSYVAETRAVIMRDENEPSDKDILMLIQNLLLLYQIHWQEQTRNTPLAGQAIGGFPDTVFDSYIKDIRQWIEELPLS